MYLFSVLVGGVHAVDLLKHFNILKLIFSIFLTGSRVYIFLRDSWVCLGFFGLLLFLFWEGTYYQSVKAFQYFKAHIFLSFLGGLGGWVGFFGA